ncbi:MAG: type II secretion system F family protein [bacterium]
MNRDLLFIDTLSMLLDKGYDIDEALEICHCIDPHPAISAIHMHFQEGEALAEIIEQLDLPSTFLAFYRFFKLRSSVSTAMRNALTICLKVKNVKNRIIKKMAYPIFLIAFTLLFSLFVTFYLFPQLDRLFTSFDVKQSLLFRILFLLIRFFPICIMMVSLVVLIFFAHLGYVIKNKRYKQIEKYMHHRYIGNYLKTYFTFKFAIYFNEMLKDHLDTNTIIDILNQNMDGDMKIIVYEISSKIKKGEMFEDIIRNFEYFDPLFVTLYNVYLRDPDRSSAIDEYISMTSNKIDHQVETFIKIVTPAIYCFVSFFILTVYLGVILPMMNIIADI